jgi:folylpolyglutamate synthase/dihydropteroate synthase
MLQMVSGYFDELLVARIQYERTATVQEISELCARLKIVCSIVQEPAKFVDSFKTRNSDECLVVLGSMYLLGEIKQQLQVEVT